MSFRSWICNRAIAGEEKKLYYVVPAHRFDKYKKQELVMGQTSLLTAVALEPSKQRSAGMR